ncbi:AEC family transporter [bacterium]|nr:AEC family transporter [bacterium]
MEILDTVLPVFLVIGLGAFLRARGFLDAVVRRALTRLVFYVSAPALLIVSTADTPVTESLNPRVLGAVIAVTVVTAFVTYALSFRTAPARRGVIAQGAHRSNMVFMGLPILAYAQGDAAVGAAGVLIGVMVVVYNALAVVLLSLPHGRGDGGLARRGLAAVGEMGRNPLIIGCVVGLFLAVANLPIPLMLDRALGLVGRTALPLALLTVGADLDFRDLRGDVVSTGAVALVKLIVYPGLVALALLALGLRGPALAAPVLLMASPTAVVSFVMAREMRGDHRLASSIVIGTTLASLVTYTAWLVVLRTG